MIRLIPALAGVISALVLVPIVVRILPIIVTSLVVIIAAVVVAPTIVVPTPIVIVAPIVVFVAIIIIPVTVFCVWALVIRTWSVVILVVHQFFCMCVVSVRYSDSTSYIRTALGYACRNGRSDNVCGVCNLERSGRGSGMWYTALPAGRGFPLLLGRRVVELSLTYYVRYRVVRLCSSRAQLAFP